VTLFFLIQIYKTAALLSYRICGSRRLKFFVLVIALVIVVEAAIVVVPFVVRRKGC
jgi:hypothetical protein